MARADLLVVCFILIYNPIRETTSSPKGLEVIPERAEIIYANDKFVGNYSLTIRRYSRKGSYVVNFKGTIKHAWNNNITVDVVMYEYLHNEYKRSFVELHYKLCDLLNNEEFIGIASKKGEVLYCPLSKGYYEITNATMYFPNFPYKFPLEKCMAEIVLTSQTMHEVIVKAHLYVVAKQLYH